MTTKTGQAEWRALDENQKMRELPLAIELQDFTIDEYPPKLMLINNETGEALPSKKPENLLIEENFHTGRLLDWEIGIEKENTSGCQCSDSGYVEFCRISFNGGYLCCLSESCE